MPGSGSRDELGAGNGQELLHRDSRVGSQDPVFMKGAGWDP